MSQQINLTPEKITQFTKEYEFLSNEYTCNVEYDGFTFQSAATLFYAFKAKSEGSFKKFQRLNPLKARTKMQKMESNDDYEANKKHYLKEAVRAKFNSNPDLKKLLVDTGRARLINTVTHMDTWIGVRNGIGENMLGRVLEELRDEYKKEEN